MNFEIILLSDEAVNSVEWYLSGEHSLVCRLPFSYNKLEYKNRESKANIDLIRRAGADIQAFLISLKKAYHKTREFTKVNFLYSNKSKFKNSLLLDILLEGFTLANYSFNKLKTNRDSIGLKIESSFSNPLISASVLGTYVSRDLVNQPLSHLNAPKLSQVLKNLSKDSGFQLNVLDKKKIQDLKMGGVLSVNKGSVVEPTFNILTYKSKNSKSKNPIVLVGKGVMYDTGGLSLKPTPNSMDMMKCDMGGAASVIGAIYALALSKANCHVVGLIPAVENRPGGEAYVPGDVIKMMNGSTVEVLNTDAEGRLILADALHYAQRYKPKLVIDLATLTGAAARTIGKHGIVGMENYSKESFADFSENMKLLLASGIFVGERVAVQPFWDDYNKELESTVADIKNLGSSEGGHITAGKFLETFVDYPWIHLDIAGSAFLKRRHLYHSEGGTGVGVRLLTHFISNLSD